MAEKSKSETMKETTTGVFALAVLGLLGYFYLSGGDPEPPKTAVPLEGAIAPAMTAEEIAAQKQAEKEAAAEKAKAKMYGHHCLSAWDGSMPAFERLVAEHIIDNESYDLESTVTYPVNEEGRNSILTTFKARNGLGGMVPGRAFGSFNNETCGDVTLETME